MEFDEKDTSLGNNNQKNCLNYLRSRIWANYDLNKSILMIENMDECNYSYYLINPWKVNLYFLNGDIPSARQNLTTLNNKQLFYMALSYLELELNEFTDEIIEIIKNRIESDNDDSLTTMELAYLLQKANKFDLSLDYYYQAWINSELNYINAYYYANLLRTSGQCNLAVDVLEEYFDEDTFRKSKRFQFDLSYLEEFSLCLMQINEIERAQEILNVAWELLEIMEVDTSSKVLTDREERLIKIQNELDAKKN